MARRVPEFGIFDRMGTKSGAAGAITLFIASRLRDEQKRLGLTLYGMEALTGVPRKSISNYLTGTRAVPVEEFVRLCVGIDLDPIELLDLAIMSTTAQTAP